MLLCLAACAGDLHDRERFDVRDPVLGSAPAGTAVPVEPGTMQGLAVPVIDAGPSWPGLPDAAAGDAAVGNLPPPALPVPACVVNLFASHCAGSTCHVPGGRSVDLVSPYLAERLIDQPAPDGSPCSGQLLLATNGSESLLLTKLQDPPACGDRMPPSGKVSNPQERCLDSWVQSLQRDELDAGSP